MNLKRPLLHSDCVEHAFLKTASLDGFFLDVSVDDETLFYQGFFYQTQINKLYLSSSPKSIQRLVSKKFSTVLSKVPLQ